MRACKQCGSYAINPRNHGRDPSIGLDLCDVCYWRVAAEDLKARVESLRAHEMAMTNYLENGGLFNPELMDHQKVSGVILRARDAIREALR